MKVCDSILKRKKTRKKLKFCNLNEKKVIRFVLENIVDCLIEVISILKTLPSPLLTYAHTHKHINREEEENKNKWNLYFLYLCL